MTKLILLFLVPIAALIITSCNSSQDPVTPAPKGSIYLESNPSGAQIWLDGLNTLRSTPDTINDVEEGAHNITLKLTEYNDTTIAISVTSGQITIVPNILLVTDIAKTLFGPVRIYESLGTTSLEPSGLDLSSGMAWGVSSDSSSLVDIYYYSDAAGTSYLVQSADLYPNLIRATIFSVAAGDNLFDGVDSPLKTIGTWTNNIDDVETHYVFLYDHDGHYSKLKIVTMGGGVPGEPAWLEVQWYYNTKLLDNRF